MVAARQFSPKLHITRPKRKLISLQVIFLVVVLVFSSVTLWYTSQFLNKLTIITHHGRTSLDDTAADIVQTKNDGHAHIIADASDQEPPPVRIAHVISLITCHKAGRVKGFLDALVILRHSIHQNSVHTPGSGSRYSYQMYAILHPDGGCLSHVPLLKRLGYIPLVRETPVNISDITTNDWYKNHVEGENCCGSKEFIKLYAYTLTSHPIVVHWDLDVAVFKPLDDLFDAMLFDKDAPRGAAARQRLHVQRPSLPLPDRIDAFFTRDVTSAAPWEKRLAVQGGFVVARPSMEHFQAYQKFIMQANYTRGRGPASGWGGLGYGGFQGAMAYQGVLAYFYDQLYPGISVELDVCRWNQVVADVLWRGPERMEHHLQCRQYPLEGISFEQNTPDHGQCHDCRVLPVEETFTAHYTACKKPWECTLPTPRVPRRKAQEYRLKHLTNVTTCGLLFHKYFEIRRQVEDWMVRKGGFPADEGDESRAETYNGKFHPEYFLGYCKRSGGYSAMHVIPEDFDMKQVYGF